MTKFLGLTMAVALISVGASASASDSFRVIAKYCANPWDGHEGHYWGGAEHAADREALKICFPYQMQRQSEYDYAETNECQAGLYGSVATALYSCAKDTPRQPARERSEDECRHAPGPIKGC